MGIGNILEDRNGKVPNQRLELSVRGCECTSDTSDAIGTCSDLAGDWVNSTYNHATDWKELSHDDSFVLKIWSVSYIWQPCIGCLSTVIFGLICSGIVIAINRKSIEKVHKNLLSKPWLRFWEKIFGEDRMSEWVEYTDEETFRNKASNNSFTVNGGKPADLTTDNNNAISLKTYEYGTIPKVKLNVSHSSF